MSEVTWGRRLALAAVLVQAPRLILAALAADRLQVPTFFEGVALTVSGAGAALVLTGGGVYLAHVVGLTGRWWVAVLWMGVLGCTALLLTPAQVAGLEGLRLADVLATRSHRWGWAAVHVLASELVAAACMLAALSAERRGGGGQPDRAARPASGIIQLNLSSAAQQQSAQQRRAEPTQSAQPEVACRNGCGWKGSQMGERGHQRTCPTRRHHEGEVS